MPCHRRQRRYPVVRPDHGVNWHKVFVALAHVPEIDADNPPFFVQLANDGAWRGIFQHLFRRESLFRFFFGCLLLLRIFCRTFIFGGRFHCFDGLHCRNHGPGRLQRIHGHNRRDEVLKRRLQVVDHRAGGLLVTP